MTWENASKFCQRTYGGHLPSIHGKAYQLFLNQFVYSTCTNNCNQIGFWIGGNKYGETYTWKWSDNTTFDFSPQQSEIEVVDPDTDPADLQCMALRYALENFEMEYCC